VLNAGFHSFYAFRLHPEALDDTKGHFYVIFLLFMPFYWFYAFLGYGWQGGAFLCSFLHFVRIFAPYQEFCGVVQHLILVNFDPQK